jgi:uncharacterized Tic20 family protein
MSMPGAGAPLAPSEERTWAILAHIGSLVAAWFAMGFLCPLVIWLIYRDRSEYVRRHALESLNFQLSLLIYSIGSGFVVVILTFVTFGLAALLLIPLLAIGAIAALVVIIRGSVAASNGQEYRYPLTIRLVH